MEAHNIPSEKTNTRPSLLCLVTFSFQMMGCGSSKMTTSIARLTKLVAISVDFWVDKLEQWPSSQGCQIFVTGRHLRQVMMIATL